MPITLLPLILLASLAGEIPPRATENPREDGAVSVELKGGVRLLGVVDARTDDRELWLCFAMGQISLSRSVRWNEIRRATVQGAILSGQAFKKLALDMRSAAGGEIARGGGMQPSAVEARRITVVASQAPPLQIRALRIEARLANWDADVEDDGLELRIEPLGDFGEIVPVDGLLNVRLAGVLRRLERQRRHFPEIGHWAQRVRAADFGTDGAIYRLAFQNVHPEFDLDYGSSGQLHAQLSVAGQGNFEAAVPVRMRAPNRVRDQLELRERRRFFPFERTGH